MEEHSENVRPSGKHAGGEKGKVSKGRILWWIGAAAMACLTLWKLHFYYDWMDAGAALWPAVGITFAALVLLSMAFKRKWIFGIVYLLLSALMAADVNYFNFFNRKLTVSAISSAGGLVGGVFDAVKAAFMLSSLWIFVDALLVILLGIIGTAVRRHRTPKGEKWSAGRFSSRKNRLCFMIAFLLMMTGLVAILPNSNSMAGSVLNTEFFSFHLRDLTGIHVLDPSGKDYSNIGLYQGDYETEKEGPDFGVAKDMNLIVIQVEAMQNFVDFD